eukprot:14242360-Alexandrium_andersonii.AAC.1
MPSRQPARPAAGSRLATSPRPLGLGRWQGRALGLGTPAQAPTRPRTLPAHSPSDARSTKPEPSRELKVLLSSRSRWSPRVRRTGGGWTCEGRSAPAETSCVAAAITSSVTGVPSKQ